MDGGVDQAGAAQPEIMILHGTGKWRLYPCHKCIIYIAALSHEDGYMYQPHPSDKQAR